MVRLPLAVRPVLDSVSPAVSLLPVCTEMTAGSLAPLRVMVTSCVAWRASWEPEAVR